MFSIGDRFKSEPGSSICGRCGGSKQQFTGQHTWQDHQTDDCIFSLKERLFGSYGDSISPIDGSVANQLQQALRAIETLRVECDDYKKRLVLLEMNPLDRIARET